VSRCSVLLKKEIISFYCDGNSRIILNTPQPISNLNVFIKILSSFVKGAMFVNRITSQTTLLHLQRIRAVERLIILIALIAQLIILIVR